MVAEGHGKSTGKVPFRSTVAVTVIVVFVTFQHRKDSYSIGDIENNEYTHCMVCALKKSKNKKKKTKKKTHSCTPSY